ncbi:MAG: biotin transporter BioY [Planctomycetota bacterium]|jgi:biotin transporter BioY
MLTNATMAGLLRPSDKRLAGFYDVALIIAGSLLIALCAQAKIWLPKNPVPVTGQTFAVLMIGALFGARRGCFTVIAYITAGLAGLPVFALGGGLAVLRGFTGGYLVGFVAAAYIVGLLAEKEWDRRVWTTILAMLLGNIVLYTFGLLWLSCLPGINNILQVGLYPFIIGDLLKIALAAALLPSGWKLLRILNLGPEEGLDNGDGA